MLDPCHPSDVETALIPAPPASHANSAFLPPIAAAWAIGVGILVLLGWVLDNETLKRVMPGLVAMNPVTALSFIACGISLGLLTRSPLSRRRRAIANVMAASVALLGLFKLVEVIVGWEVGVDRLLFASKLETTLVGQVPNRMAPNTAFNFLLLGVALLGIDVPAQWRVRALEWWPFQWFALLAAFASLLAIVGYAYGARYFYGIGSFIPMALHTALTFVMLLLGVLYARPSRGIMEIVTSYSAGGAMARRSLPAAILLPAALGWLRLTGERMGFYNGEVGVALLVVSVMLVFSVLVWWNARALFYIDVERRQAVQGMQVANLQLERLATTDGLTGLQNRRSFDEHIAREFARASRQQTPLSLLLLDVDHFKAYNDSFGHPAGDEVLRQGAQLIPSQTRQVDLAARYGGEEFAVILPNTGQSGAMVLAQRIVSSFESRSWPQRSITVSIGVAAWEPEVSITDAGISSGRGPSLGMPEHLVSQADGALYQAKSNGRNCVVSALSMASLSGPVNSN